MRHDALAQRRHDGAVTDVVVGVASQQQDPRPRSRHVRQVPRARPSSPGRLEADRCLAGPSETQMLVVIGLPAADLHHSSCNARAALQGYGIHIKYRP